MPISPTRGAPCGFAEISALSDSCEITIESTERVIEMAEKIFRQYSPRTIEAIETKDATSDVVGVAEWNCFDDLSMSCGKVWEVCNSAHHLEISFISKLGGNLL